MTEVQGYLMLAKLLEVRVWISHFAHNAQDRYRCERLFNIEEWNEAERYWVRQIQNEMFGQGKFWEKFWVTYQND